MSKAYLRERRWGKWGSLFLLWTLIGLSFATQFYISSANVPGFPITWRQAVTWSLADWYVFAVLSMLAVGLVRKFPLNRRRWGQSLIPHILGSILFSLMYMILRAWVAQWQPLPGGQTGSFAAAFRPLLVKTWHFNWIIYWVVVSVTLAMDYYRESQERELRTMELEKRLVQAQLQALQMQLNPHFLFNALNAISSLMHKNVEAADRMLARLADLLRYSLENTDKQEIPLRQELDFLRRYLEIERIRFGDRLAVGIEVDPDLMDALVPKLILQPLVENAVRHGIGPHAQAGRIIVRAQYRDDRLQLEVMDNGKGLSRSGPIAEGVGLTNTRARLQQLYGGAQQMTLRNLPASGLQVTLSLPFRRATDHPGP